jgi:ParB family chromosome partitioning protein
MSSGEKKLDKLQKPVVRKIPVNLIDVPEVRVTSKLPEELEEAFKESIKAQGVVNPILVVPNGDRYVLVDGLHRLQEAVLNGETEITAVVRPGTYQDVLLWNLTTGKLQGRGKVTDMIRVVKYLREEVGMPLEDIAAKTGYRLRYLEDLLAIAKAHPDILMALDEEKIPLGAAIEIARIPDTDAQIKVLWNAIMYRMTIRDVKELVEKTLEQLERRKAMGEEAKPRTPRELVLLECHLCEGKFPAKDMRSVFLCPHCMNVLWDMKLEAMKEAEKMRLEAEAKAQEATRVTSVTEEHESGEEQGHAPG